MKPYVMADGTKVQALLYDGDEAEVAAAVEPFDGSVVSVATVSQPGGLMVFHPDGNHYELEPGGYVVVFPVDDPRSFWLLTAAQFTDEFTPA